MDPKTLIIMALPVGSYPTPFLGYLLFYIADPNHKVGYPKKRGRL